MVYMDGRGDVCVSDVLMSVYNNFKFGIVQSNLYANIYLYTKCGLYVDEKLRQLWRIQSKSAKGCFNPHVPLIFPCIYQSEFKLSSNKISGPIVPELFNLVLSLQDNALDEILPLEIGT